MEILEGAVSTPDTLADALDQVNEIRVALAIGEGKLAELPRGVRKDSHQCVLARALSNGWTAETMEDSIVLAYSGPDPQPYVVAALRARGFDAKPLVPWREPFDVSPICTRVYVPLTPEFQYLIDDFDRGLLPDLILTDPEGSTP